MNCFKTITLMLLFPAAALAQQGAPIQMPVTAPAPTGISSDAPIGPRDRVDVRVFQDPSLNTIATVAEDGMINMAIIGRVDLSGLAPRQAEAKIKGLLEANILRKADVTVQVVEAGNKPISVVGAVTRPGRIAATGNITLIQALTQAGGLGAGYGHELYVLRTGQNGLTERIAIDIEDLLVNGNPDLNLPLAANDVVNVPTDTPIIVYVLGEVMHPGTVQFRRSQQPMLLQALAGAGGPTDRASKTVIVKRQVNGVEKTISVNFKRVISGKSPDVQLLDNDTVYVNESVF